jgi:hypothetical protein
MENGRSQCDENTPSAPISSRPALEERERERERERADQCFGIRRRRPTTQDLAGIWCTTPATAADVARASRYRPDILRLFRLQQPSARTGYQFTERPRVSMCDARTTSKQRSGTYTSRLRRSRKSDGGEEGLACVPVHPPLYRSQLLSQLSHVASDLDRRWAWYPSRYSEIFAPFMCYYRTPRSVSLWCDPWDHPQRRRSWSYQERCVPNIASN